MILPAASCQLQKNKNVRLLDFEGFFSLNISNFAEFFFSKKLLLFQPILLRDMYSFQGPIWILEFVFKFFFINNFPFSVVFLIPCSNLNSVVFQPIIQYTFVVQQRKSPIDTSKLPITIKAIPTMVLTSTMMVSLDMYFLMKSMPLLCCALDFVQDGIQFGTKSCKVQIF